jgi:hypothetical protein
MSTITFASSRILDDEPDLPTLRAALNPASAEAALVERVSVLIGGRTTLRSIGVKAYKPGRRCLIEYQLDIQRAGGTVETISLLGKIRANRFGNSGYRQLRAVWDAGFGDDSRDGISVPEPIGTVPALRMWLQRKVAGTVATDVLCGSDGVAVAERIADGIHKLHTAGVSADRRHTMADELRILVRCLGDVTTVHPELAPRIRRLIDTSVQVGGSLTSTGWCSSHRDFYSDQVLVSNGRLYLLDFDLFCEADPGLDVGNFLGHLTELGLRMYGDAGALAAVERRLEDRFVALAGERVRWSVRVFAALTIARHVYLSTRFPDRSRLTGALLAVAEQRLRSVAAEGGCA